MHNCQHLQGLVLAESNFLQSRRIDLLLGVDVIQSNPFFQKYAKD